MKMKTYREKEKQTEAEKERIWKIGEDFHCLRCSTRVLAATWGKKWWCRIAASWLEFIFFAAAVLRGWNERWESEIIIVIMMIVIVWCCGLWYMAHNRLSEWVVLVRWGWIYHECKVKISWIYRSHLSPSSRNEWTNECVLFEETQNVV